MENNNKIKKDNIVRIPITYKQRKINEYGDGFVPCEVTDRWLQFNDKEYLGMVSVDVMTLKNDESNQPHKICTLVLHIEDIKRALSSVKPNE